MREEAGAFSETELLSTEPVTIVLSERGWMRSAKVTMWISRTAVQIGGRF